MKTFKSNLRKATAIALAILMIVPMLVLPSFATENADGVLYEQDFSNFTKPSDWPSLAKAENGEMSFTLGADPSDTTKVYWLRVKDAKGKDTNNYKFGTFSGTTFTEGGKDYPVTTNGSEAGAIGTLTYNEQTVNLYCTTPDLANYITAATSAPNINYNAILSFSGVKASNVGTYIVVEMDYYLPADGKGAFQIKGKTSGGDVDFCQITLGATPVFAGAKHGGSVVNAKTLKADAWNKLQFLVNLETNVYEVYANGILSVSGECKANSFSKNGDGLKGITLWAVPRTNNVASTISALNGTVKVDNVKVKKADPAQFPLTNTTNEVGSNTNLESKVVAADYVRVPFAGSCTASNAYSGNADKSLFVDNATLRNGIYSIELKYRPHFASTTSADPTLEVQFANYSVTNPDTNASQNCSFLSLFNINLKSGLVYDSTKTAVLSNNVCMTLDEWNTVRVEFDTATGAQRTYVNGALVFVRTGYKAQYYSGGWKYITGATNFNVPTGKLIVAKCNKNVGAYATSTQEDFSDLNYVDFGGCTIKKINELSALKLTPTTEDFEDLTAGATIAKDDKHFFNSLGATGMTVWEANGNKSIKIDLTDANNADKNLQVKTPAVASVYGTVAVSARYYLSEDASGMIVPQFQNYTIDGANKYWLNFVTIDLKAGKVVYGYGRAAEKNPDLAGIQTMKHGAWNTVNYYFNLQTGEMDIYVNGLYDGTYNTNLTNIGIAANKLIIGKVLKDSDQAKQGQTLAGFYAVDDVKVYTPDADAVVTIPTTNENGSKLNYITVGGEKLYATKVLKGTEYTANYFDGTLLEGIITSVNGASVRLDENSGLRFATYIDQAKIDAIKALVDAGEIKSFKIGTLITLDSYKTAAGAGTKEALDALAKTGNGGKTYIDVAAEYNVWFNHTKAGLTVGEGQAVFAGTISNIKTNHYDAAMYGVGYVEVTLLSGETIIVYGAGYTASVKEKAQLILDGDTTDYTAEELTILKTFASAAGN